MSSIGIVDGSGPAAAVVHRRRAPRDWRRSVLRAAPSRKHGPARASGPRRPREISRWRSPNLSRIPTAGPPARSSPVRGRGRGVGRALPAVAVGRADHGAPPRGPAGRGRASSSSLPRTGEKPARPTGFPLPIARRTRPRRSRARAAAGEFTDGRDRAVLAATRRIPDIGWAIVVEVDRNAALGRGLAPVLWIVLTAGAVFAAATGSAWPGGGRSVCATSRSSPSATGATRRSSSRLRKRSWSPSTAKWPMRIRLASRCSGTSARSSVCRCRSFSRRARASRSAISSSNAEPAARRRDSTKPWDCGRTARPSTSRSASRRSSSTRRPVPRRSCATSRGASAWRPG